MEPTTRHHKKRRNNQIILHCLGSSRLFGIRVRFTNPRIKAFIKRTLQRTNEFFEGDSSSDCYPDVYQDEEKSKSSVAVPDNVRSYYKDPLDSKLVR